MNSRLIKQDKFVKRYFVKNMENWKDWILEKVVMIRIHIDERNCLLNVRLLWEYLCLLFSIWTLPS